MRCSIGDRAIGLVRLAPAFKDCDNLYVTDLYGQRIAVSIHKPNWWPDDLIIQ